MSQHITIITWLLQSRNLSTCVLGTLPVQVDPCSLDNRELDKLVAALGRSKTTWRRALVLHEWLLTVGHDPDDRLCTSLMRVCQQHGQVVTALSLYEWMRAGRDEGGAGLSPTVFTYTIAMRAALGANMVDKALKVSGAVPAVQAASAAMAWVW
jgi:hypothetical protein